EVDEAFPGEPDGLAMLDLVGLEAVRLAAEADGPHVDGDHIVDGFAAVGKDDLAGGRAVGEEGGVEDVEESIHAALSAVHALVEGVDQTQGAPGGGIGARLAQV